MTTYSAAFYDALTSAVKCAIDAYPEDSATIRRAVDLVLNGHVVLTEGQALVTSATDPSMRYVVNGKCDCIAFVHSKHGRCKHRFAVALYKRAVANDVWSLSHSEARRDAEAVKGVNHAAVVCHPEHQHERALSGFAVTPDGRAGLSQR
jgi:hypothetical protein